MYFSCFSLLYYVFTSSNPSLPHLYPHCHATLYSLVAYYFLCYTQAIANKIPAASNDKQHLILNGKYCLRAFFCMLYVWMLLLLLLYVLCKKKYRFIHMDGFVEDWPLIKMNPKQPTNNTKRRNIHKHRKFPPATCTKKYMF